MSKIKKGSRVIFSWHDPNGYGFGAPPPGLNQSATGVVVSDPDQKGCVLVACEPDTNRLEHDPRCWVFWCSSNSLREIK